MRKEKTEQSRRSMPTHRTRHEQRRPLSCWRPGKTSAKCRCWATATSPQREDLRQTEATDLGRSLSSCAYLTCHSRPDIGSCCCQRFAATWSCMGKGLLETHVGVADRHTLAWLKVVRRDERGAEVMAVVRRGDGQDPLQTLQVRACIRLVSPWLLHRESRHTVKRDQRGSCNSVALARW